MVNEQEQNSDRRRGDQEVRDVIPEPNKINACTPYDFNGKNLTPYGGLLPVITMLEKLGFQSLVEQTVTSKRIPRAMDLYRFVLSVVLGLYIGFPRLNQLRFIARDPILTGILKVTKLPVQELRQAQWKPSPKTDADAECEFRYQPEGWSKPYRFVALRKEKPREELETEEIEQYQLFETRQYKYRVFVTDMSDPIYFVVWFYGQRGGAENLIKEANNDAGLAAHPSGRFDVNGNHFQLAMLAYNLNCWLMLFNREPQTDATELKHTTLATARLRFLFVAAKIWRHAGRTGVSYSDHYEEKGVFERLMDRLRRIAPRANGYAPVMVPALR